jgi:hypothetical protein
MGKLRVRESHRPRVRVETPRDLNPGLLFFRACTPHHHIVGSVYRLQGPYRTVSQHRNKSSFSSDSTPNIYLPAKDFYSCFTEKVRAVQKRRISHLLSLSPTF